MATSDTFAFWTVFLIIMFTNIITPYVSDAFSQTYTSHETEDVSAPPSITDFFSLSIISFITIPFWTFGMPVLMNLFIMIPLRALAYILLLRMIRGN